MIPLFNQCLIYINPTVIKTMMKDSNFQLLKIPSVTDKSIQKDMECSDITFR